MTEFDEAHLSLRRKVAEAVSCPSCEAEHIPEDVLVLGYQDGLWVVVVVCARCHWQGILFLRQSPPNLPPGSELDAEEWVRFQHLSAIDRAEAQRLKDAIWALDGPFEDDL